jgi:hypothetical protein
VRQPWRATRPILAATFASERWHLAWLSSKGVIAAESKKYAAQKGFPELTPVRPWPLFASIPRMEFGIKLAFSDDASYLTLIAQREPGVVDVRAWDFSPERTAQIEKFQLKDLVAEACRISSLEGDGDYRLSDSAIAVWRSVGSMQPCEDQK